MSESLRTIAALVLPLLPVGVAAVARSKGRSPFNWGFLSLALTPVGALILLVILPARECGAADGPAGAVVGLAMPPGMFSKVALGRRAEAARQAELDRRLTAESREARADRLIADHLKALKAAPTPGIAPVGATDGARPIFGKRRQM